MTYIEIRKALVKENPKPIRWDNSGIVELATLEPNGAISIFNAISGKRYIMPRRDEIKFSFIDKESFIALGDLFPKYLKKEQA